MYVSRTTLSPLHRLRDRKRRSTVLWLLAFVLLAHTFIPIQSHTRLVVDGDGIVVEMCTLQGTTLVELPIDGTQHAPSTDDSKLSPAMAFSQLAAEALLGTPDTQPAWLSLVTREPPPAVIGTPTRRPLRSFRIRAPPSLV